MRIDRTKQGCVAYERSAAARLLLSLLTMIVLCGCAVVKDSLSPIPDLSGPYRLHAGDSIAVTVHGAEGFSDIYKIDANGIVRIRYIQEINAQGFTITEITIELSRRFKEAGIYQTPEVTIQVETYRPIYVVGQVNAPGSYPYSAGMTVLAAIATAGGLAPFADERYTIRRSVEPGKAIEGSATEDTPLYPGDILTISNPRNFSASRPQRSHPL